MLLVAGTIEGFFSATDAPMAMKFALGGVLTALLATYLFGTSRDAVNADDGQPTAGSGL
jgi:hypothetical protein